MKNLAVIAAALALLALASCGEWQTFALVNPASGAEAACSVPWGTSLPDVDIQRLHECVEACEARGFHLNNPESLPRPVPFVNSAPPPSIPQECAA